MEKKIIILGKIGKTVFQNNDRGKVISGGGISKAIYAGISHGIAPMVVKKWNRK